jgi:histidinol-phosphate/aromatic aminotransferase/cobyric acid decarboxylase-like protein
VGYIVEELTKVPGLKPYNSHGNYVFVDATDAGLTGQEIVDYVFEKDKIMIKAYASFRGRKGFFRITVGTHEENIACVQGIKRYVANRKK